MHGFICLACLVQEKHIFKVSVSCSGSRFIIPEPASLSASRVSWMQEKSASLYNVRGEIQMIPESVNKK